MSDDDQMRTPLKISAQGRAMVQHFEGCLLRAYPDTGGVPTVGYGTTGPHVMPGMVISQAQAELWLDKALDGIAAGISRECPSQLPQGQMDALVSFAYNEGLHALLTSTLYLRTRAGDVAAAAAEFEKWVYGHDQAGGKIVLPGLVRRRAAEREMFLTGQWAVT